MTILYSRMGRCRSPLICLMKKRILYQLEHTSSARIAILQDRQVQESIDMSYEGALRLDSCCGG